jgi:hypothetical protein
MTTNEVEIAVARFFDYRINIIVPNVSWGLGLHECDLLIVSTKGYATEVEIKTSVADIKADLKKRHEHHSEKIRQFSFAVPEDLACSQHLPTDCGLITVSPEMKCTVIRPPRINSKARRLTDKEINKLLHLGCMRIWHLKEAVMTAKKRNHRIIEVKP